MSFLWCENSKYKEIRFTLLMLCLYGDRMRLSDNDEVQEEHPYMAFINLNEPDKDKSTLKILHLNKKTLNCILINKANANNP